MKKRVLNIKTKSFEEFAIIMGEFEAEKRLFAKSWLTFNASNIEFGDSRLSELEQCLKDNNINYEVFEVDMRYPTTNVEPSYC